MFVGYKGDFGWSVCWRAVVVTKRNDLWAMIHANIERETQRDSRQSIKNVNRSAESFRCLSSHSSIPSAEQIMQSVKCIANISIEWKIPWQSVKTDIHPTIYRILFCLDISFLYPCHKGAHRTHSGSCHYQPHTHIRRVHCVLCVHHTRCMHALQYIYRELLLLFSGTMNLKLWTEPLRVHKEPVHC